MVVPPLVEREIGSGFVLKFPVELRNHIVDPAVFRPQEHVGIERIVVLETIGVGAAGV